MSIKIFTMTHKKFDVPEDKMYVPLQVGKAVHEDLGYLGDDTGDNISKLNCYYSELTGIYWVWKNYHDSDYVGVCHYRRYLINEQGKVFTEYELQQILEHFDVVTTKRVKLRLPYYDGYASTHHIENLDATGDVIKEKYPEYYANFEKLVHSDETYFGNIMVCSKQLFDEYCEWLFGIFEEVQKRVDIDSYDDYHKRVFGFISEILLMVWVRTRKLSVYDCKVGMIGEKVETREMKEQLAQYFREQDISGAKQYFSESLKRRPDVLMEASDITGELKLSMQVIATCEMEYENSQNSIIDEMTQFEELMSCFRQLNSAVEAYRKGQNSKEKIQFLSSDNITAYAIFVSVRVLCKNDELQDTFRKIIDDMQKFGNNCDKKVKILQNLSKNQVK